MKCQTVCSMVCLALFLGACRSTFSPEVESLLAKMKTAVDPHGRIESIESQEVRGNFRRSTADRGATMSIRAVRPDKVRTDIIIPGDVSIIRTFNGKTAWEYTTRAGYRELVGTELSRIKLQALSIVDFRLPAAVSSQIVIDGEAQVMGAQCIRLVCTPKEEFEFQPFTLFVDKNSFLIRKRVEEHGNQDIGSFQVSTVYDDYFDYDGVLVPRTMISQVHNQIIEYDVTSVAWNEKFHDATFNPPEKLK